MEKIQCECMALDQDWHLKGRSVTIQGFPFPTITWSAAVGEDGKLRNLAIHV